MEKKTLKENYELFSEFYEIIGNKRNHFITQYNFIDRIISNNLNIHNILDASCGTGNVINLLRQKKKNINLYGSDFCEAFIKIAKKKNKEIAENIRLSDWIHLKSTFKNEKFDLVYILGNSIAHVESLDKLKLVFRNIYNILNDNGIFIFDLRNWEKDVKEKLFNLPNNSSEITFNTNKGTKVIYTTNYEFSNKRHNLIHKFYNNDQIIKTIEFSFIELSNDEIINSLKSEKFCKIEIINDQSYPYKVFKVSKCK